VDDDGDGYSEADGDCDDDNDDVFPGAVERDNNRDDDCDGEVDEPSGIPPGLEGLDVDEDGCSCRADGEPVGRGSLLLMGLLLASSLRLRRRHPDR